MLMHHAVFFRKFPGKFRKISGKCPGKFPDIARKCPEISKKFREMSGECLGNVQEMSGKFHGYFPDFSWNSRFSSILRKKSRICLRIVLEISWKCPGSVWAMFKNFLEKIRKCPRNFTEISPEISGNVPELFRKFSGNFLNMSWRFPRNA